jgi:hypothetical protein
VCDVQKRNLDKDTKMPHDILIQALKQASEEMGFYVSGIDNSGNTEMKTKYKYIEFIQDGKNWRCDNHKYQQVLGWVSYYARWKEWEFMPEPDTGYTIVCLRDITDFLDQLNKEGKPK